MLCLGLARFQTKTGSRPRSLGLESQTGHGRRRTVDRRTRRGMVSPQPEKVRGVGAVATRDRRQYRDRDPRHFQRRRDLDRSGENSDPGGHLVSQRSTLG
uniref:Uncharacterized protein n=1 Tax=uncultured marine virus TaxID=186617 RepID=A0A0F7LAT6_9VIRU|nr:hypothetical protein [uncultured marine virus]